MENLTSLINRLISYGLCRGLIKQSDSVYVRNRLFDLFKLDAPENLCDENCFVQTETINIRTISIKIKKGIARYRRIKETTINKNADRRK